jgi:hypothetical protein
MPKQKKPQTKIVFDNGIYHVIRGNRFLFTGTYADCEYYLKNN